MTVYPNVTPVVSVNVIPGDTICAGTSVQFISSSQNSGFSPAFIWKKNGSTVGSGTSYIDNNLATGDQITCMMTSNAACAIPVTVTGNIITMNVISPLIPSVTVTASPGNMVCPGATITFNAAPVNGGLTPTYLWKKNGIMTGSNSSSYSDNSFSSNDSVICVMISSETCVAPASVSSNAVKIILNSTIVPEVTITSNAGSNICTGQPVTFTAHPLHGGTQPMFQWKKNGSNVGTDSTEYSDISLQDNDVISCSMISNDSCIVGNPASSNNIRMSVGSCGSTVDLHMFIQGFYRGGGQMYSVADAVNNPAVCDTVMVDLISPVSPFTIVSSVKGVIDINGYGQFYFPNAVMNNDYYLAIRHRNSLEVWTVAPVTITSPNVSYDFTASVNSAYGNNLVQLVDGNFALWSGDVSDGTSMIQDGIINADDFTAIKSAAANFTTGYSIPDLTGDGFIESADFSMIENNIDMLISVARP
jgi:hypothetical protein